MSVVFDINAIILKNILSKMSRFYGNKLVLDKDGIMIFGSNKLCITLEPKIMKGYDYNDITRYYNISGSKIYTEIPKKKGIDITITVNTSFGLDFDGFKYKMMLSEKEPFPIRKLEEVDTTIIIHNTLSLNKLLKMHKNSIDIWTEGTKIFVGNIDTYGEFDDVIKGNQINYSIFNTKILSMMNIKGEYCGIEFSSVNSECKFLWVDSGVIYEYFTGIHKNTP